MDVHQAITDRIIEAIERGAGEFKLPWLRPAGSITRPVNIQSGKGFRGINVVTLRVEAQLRGYATPVWGTYKQFQEKGCQVRKGEKTSLVVFYKELEYAREEPQEGEDDTRSVWMARGMSGAWKCGSGCRNDRFRLLLAQAVRKCWRAVELLKRMPVAAPTTAENA